MAALHTRTDQEPGGSFQQSSSGISSVWKYFSKGEAGKNFTCKICKSVLKYNKSTSGMHTHLKRHPLTLGEEQRKSSTQQSIKDFTKQKTEANHQFTGSFHCQRHSTISCSAQRATCLSDLITDLCSQIHLETELQCCF